MTREQLHTYLANAFQLESDLYRTEELKRNLLARSDTLCRRVNIVREHIDDVSNDEVTYFPVCRWVRDHDLWELIPSLIGFIVGFVIDLFILPIQCIESIILYSHNKSSLAKKNRSANERYQIALMSEENRLKNEQIQKEYINQQIAVLDSYHTRISNDLDQLYSDGTLKPQYRNFIAVAKLYEYIDSEMTDTLTGPSGAYSKYENQLLAGMICASINDLQQAVVQHLTNIERAQYNIFKAIEHTNELLKSIDNNLYSVGQSLESTNRLLNEISNHTFSASQYLGEYCDQLRKIGEGIDKAAIKNASDVLNNTLIEHEERVKDYYRSFT